MPDPIVDPLDSPPMALDGRVVTMNERFDVIDRGRVYLTGGRIVTVTTDDAEPPPGFEEAPVMRTGGTIYPGLIELHNHLPYNVLPPWQVPELYGNRSQWGRHPDYRRLVSGPMSVLGKTAGYIEAVVRYVEVKALVAGVTTSQGIALFSNANTRRYHRGLVRNVEETNDPDLPELDTRVADVARSDAAAFRDRLLRGKGILLHLSEGKDDRAREHFVNLGLDGGGWAITEALVGIHAAGLLPEDFRVMGDNGGRVVWSPLSNLLLYGGTAEVEAARRAGMPVALGSDWSPTGSKNLLGELKAARAVADASGWDLADRDLAAMATIDAARAIRWDHAIGSIEAGKRADLVVLHGRRADPYRALVEAAETTVVLVIVNGVPRYGQRRLMSRIEGPTEPVTVGGSPRMLYLEQESVDPVVAAVPFAEAVERLADGMARLPELARDLEAPTAPAPGIPREGVQWFIELQEDEVDGSSMRPTFGAAFPEVAPVPSAEPLSEVLEPLSLDPLTVSDDRGYVQRMSGQMNVPAEVIAALRRLHRR